jgi:hypothetical protein
MPTESTKRRWTPGGLGEIARAGILPTRSSAAFTPRAAAIACHHRGLSVPEATAASGCLSLGPTRTPLRWLTMLLMISSAQSSRVLLLAAPGNAADATSGPARIRRYRLARVRPGARPGTAAGAAAATAGSKSAN